MGKPSIMSFFSNKYDAKEDEKLTKDAIDDHESEKEKGNSIEKSDVSPKAESTSKDATVDLPKQPPSVSFFRTHYEVNKKKEVNKVKEYIVNKSKSLSKNELVNDSQKC